MDEDDEQEGFRRGVRSALLGSAMFWGAVALVWWCSL